MTSQLTEIALQMLGTIERMELIIPEITGTIRKALEEKAALTKPEPPVDGEVAEVVALIREGVAQCIEDFPEEAGMMTRAADLLERLVPQPVREWPTDEDIMALMPPQMHEDLTVAARALAGFDSPKGATGAIRNILNCHAVDHARDVLARWGSAN